MKIEILKKAVELNKQREDILKQFRKLFSITDPHFQPISVREDKGCVFIIFSFKTRHKWQKSIWQSA